MALALMPLGAAAFDQAEADELCTRASRNQGIFELLFIDQTARPGPVAGGVTCTWRFSHVSSSPGEVDLVLTLEMQPVESVNAARRAITLALLPENRGGKIVEALPNMGDGGVQRTTVKDEVLQRLEIEAVQDRQRFLFTATPRAKVVTSKFSWRCVNFLGIGLGRLR